MWGNYELNIRYFPKLRKSIQVVYDKGKDNDATLRSKLVSAYHKTHTDMSKLNQDLQHLKKHKSILIFY